VASKITTLYIDDTCIRMMVARGRRINKMADVPLDSSTGEVSAEARQAEIVAKVKQLFKSRKINAKKVIIGMSGLHCLSRPIALPQLPKAMLGEAVMREAKRVLPMPPEQLYISWQVLSSTGSNIQAFMLGIPHQMADSMLGIVKQLGLKPYLMDVKPLALTRLVKLPTAIVMDVQAREFDIVIMADGIPQPIRTVPFPQETISLQDKMPIVKEELKRTIQFFNTNKPDKPLQSDVPIYVSGEILEEPESYQAMARELGYQVLPLTSPLKCPKQLDPSHYLVNIGLALKVLPREAGALLTNLNTLPMAYQPKPISIVKLVALPAAALAIGVIALLGMTVQDAAASIGSAQGKLDTTNKILTQRQTQKKQLTESIASLEKQLKASDASRVVFTAAFDSLNKQGDKINGDLRATTSSLVNGVALKSIMDSGQGISISGQATSEAEVLKYARQLVGSGRFSEVTVTGINRVEDSAAQNAEEPTTDGGAVDESSIGDGSSDNSSSDSGSIGDDDIGTGGSDNGTSGASSDNGTVPAAGGSGPAPASSDNMTSSDTSESSISGNALFDFTLNLKLMDKKK
jgi:type IV pilus assembly protein PilM